MLEALRQAPGAEPETRFLIAEILRPHTTKLQQLAARVITVVEDALTAKKTDEADTSPDCSAVERYCELLEMAQGKLPEKGNDGAGRAGSSCVIPALKESGSSARSPWPWSRGEGIKTTARDIGCSKRYVRHLAAVSVARFLITEVLRPYYATLNQLAARVITGSGSGHGI